jgi:pilus assembly protein CpaF
VHSQLAAALDVVVHLVREAPGGRRRVAEICVFQRRPDGLVEVVPAVSYGADGAIHEGPGAPALAARLGGPPP